MHTCTAQHLIWHACSCKPSLMAHSCMDLLSLPFHTPWSDLPRPRQISRPCSLRCNVPGCIEPQGPDVLSMRNCSSSACSAYPPKSQIMFRCMHAIRNSAGHILHFRLNCACIPTVRSPYTAYNPCTGSRAILTCSSLIWHTYCLQQ